jgi:hypothetical protein
MKPRPDLVAYGEQAFEATQNIILRLNSVLFFKEFI